MNPPFVHDDESREWCAEECQDGGFERGLSGHQASRPLLTKDGVLGEQDVPRVDERGEVHDGRRMFRITRAAEPGFYVNMRFRKCAV